ncbi:glutathione S-transferase family protein [Lutimaribacter marinistellae]|uniref:Glutathione S-transferase family protein n=1 Tax=Lutimaribacter marinistellae TaxID=1820329 RepID=A0ABV7TK67_9RHOB
MITVYHLSQSRSLRIIWLLEELGQQYEVIRFERDPQSRLAPPALTRLHPLGKAPMIEFQGRLIGESGAIVELLCSRYGPQMIPQTGTGAHIRHLEWMHFAEGSVMTPILLNLYLSRLGEAAAPLQPRIQSELTSHFQYMENGLRPSGHFVLDELSAADIMLSFPALIALRMGRGEEFPRLAEFCRRIEARPAWHRAIDAAGGD